MGADGWRLGFGFVGFCFAVSLDAVGLYSCPFIYINAYSLNSKEYIFMPTRSNAVPEFVQIIIIQYV